MKKNLVVISICIILSSCFIPFKSVTEQNLSRKPYQSMLLVFPNDVLDFYEYSTFLMSSFSKDLKAKNIKVETLDYAINDNQLKLNSNADVNMKIDSLVKGKELEAILFVRLVRVSSNYYTYNTSLVDTKTSKEVWKGVFSTTIRGSIKVLSRKASRKMYLKLQDDRFI